MFMSSNQQIKNNQLHSLLFAQNLFFLDFNIQTLSKIVQIIKRQFMSNQKQLQTASTLNYDVSGISSQIGYFLVIPSIKSQLAMPSNQQPIVLTYRDDQTSIQKLMNQFLKITKIKVKSDHHLIFTLSDGFKISPTMTVQDLKKQLQRQELNGLVLYIFQAQIVNPQPIGKNDQQGSIDECCIIEYFNESKQYNKNGQFQTVFELPGTNIIISIDSSYYMMTADVIQQFIMKFNQKYYPAIQLQDVANFMTVHNKKNISLDFNKPIRSNSKLYSGGRVLVVLKNKNASFCKKWVKDDQITIMRLYTEEFVRVNFDNIRDLTFQTVYKQYLKQINQIMPKPFNLCLKVNDFIVKPKDKMSKIQVFFNNKTQQIIRVIAKVVNQKLIFYSFCKAINDNKQIPSFKLQQLNLDKKDRQQCRTIAKDRLINNTVPEYFQKAENIQPILLYTCQYLYTDQTTKEQHLFYSYLNRFLRDKYSVDIQQQQFLQDWKCFYSGTLIKHLTQIPNQQKNVYRGDGCDYYKDYKIGQKITFKSFLSTSESVDVAQNFATTNNFGTPANPCSLLKMKIVNGKDISAYSFFSGQAEILLEPFSEFILIEKKQTTRTVAGVKCSFVEYDLEQIKYSREMPKSKANFIIWVDDEPYQGKKIFDSVQAFHQMTVLIQLTSTKQLQEWICKNTKLIADNTANIIFITDMTRKEGEVMNPMAGVDGIKIVKNIQKNIPIFVYVMNKEGAEAKLTANNIDRFNLVVGNSIQQFQSFISKHLKLKFKTMEVEVKQQHKHSSSFHQPGSNPESKNQNYKKVGSQIMEKKKSSSCEIQ